MNASEFKKIIAEGETSTVEFKSWKKASGMKERVKLAVDELIAFANAKGGTLFFGVEVLTSHWFTPNRKIDCN